MKTKILGALALAALLGTATAATACPSGNKGMMGGASGKGTQGCSSNKGMQGCSSNSGQMNQQKHLARKVIAAVSKAGLNAKQAAAITDAVNTFKISQMQMRANRMQMMPIDAFGDDKFDAELFKQKKQQMFDAKIAARVELFKAVYAVLTPEQRKVFKREFTAPMVQMMIKQNMVKGYMMPGKGMGQGMGKGGGMGCKNCN